MWTSPVVLRLNNTIITNRYIYIINVIENTEGAIKMDNQEKVATRRRKTNKNYYTIGVGHHYPQTNTNNVNKTWAPNATNWR